MDPGGGASGPVLGFGNVPAFLTKLWTLVEDPQTDELIHWSPSGCSFHVFDQGRFSKEVLPKFFKHNNMASFIRQLNMYGFRKVVHLEEGGLVKPERDDTEFQHPFFLRGQEHLLENIKRKVTAVPSVRQDEVKAADEVNRILTDVQLMKGKQESIDSRISAMKQENTALWREVASLRQKHTQQQKVVNKLIQFLISLVQNNRIMGLKRKMPLMLDDGSSSLPKYSRPLSLEHLQAGLFPDSVSSGPIISDITDMTTPSPDDVNSEWTDSDPIPEVKGQASGVKAEPEVETPFSPTTFINSILQEEVSSSNQRAGSQGPATSHNTRPNVAPPIVLMVPPIDQSEPIIQSPSSQSTARASSAPSASPLKKCQTIACIDRSELLDHVDLIESGLDNLQNVLNTQNFSFDTGPLLEVRHLLSREFFGSPAPAADFDLDCLDTLLAGSREDEVDSATTGKQLVQYTPLSLQEPITSLVDVLGEDPDYLLSSDL